MEYNPVRVILQIKKIEYRYLLLPFALIIGTFVAVKFYHFTQLKLLSILALILYFVIKMLFRINKIVPTEIDDSIKSVKSPINGKVINIENGIVTIYKNLFDRADFRTISSDYTIINGKIFLIEKSDVQSMLTGVTPTTVLCKIALPESYNINVKNGQKVISGITDIGIYNE